MSSMTIGLISAGCIFGGALLGLFLQGLVPEHHLRDTSKDTVKVVAGTIATLSALVLGLLVGSAKSSFDATNTAIVQNGAKIILLDRVMAGFERAAPMEEIQAKLRELMPATDAQRQLLSQAEQITNDMLQARWLLIEQAQSALPMPFLVVLLFWLTMLHLSFALFAPRNATVFAVLLISALSMSGAIFIILEMNHPLQGMIKVSSAPMRKALEHLGQ